MGEIQETAEIRAERNHQKFRTTKQGTLPAPGCACRIF